MPLRITNGFDKQSDADLSANAHAIVEAMTDNPHFPTPDPSLAKLSDDLSAFDTALAVAVNGSNYDKAVKNICRATLIDTLHLMANYVLYTAAGNRLKAQSSGFPIAKEPTTAPPLSRPENLQLSGGENSGELKISFGKVVGARSYLYQYTPDPMTESSVWENSVGTKRQAMFSGLVPGQRYWCRVVAVGTGQQAITSDAVSRIVL